MEDIVQLITRKENLRFCYSELRNPNLGALFKRLNIIEQWGTGFNKIQSALKEDYPDVELVVEDSSSFVQVCLVKSPESVSTPQEIQGTTQETTQEILGLGQTKQNIIKLLMEDPKLNRQQLAEKLFVSSDAIRQHLASLQTDGWLKRVGSTRYGYWQVIKKI